MEQLNSGDSVLEIWEDANGWLPFAEAYLVEAMEYKLRLTGVRVDVVIQGVPIAFFQQKNVWRAVFIAPFQSGVLQVQTGRGSFQSFVYPDSRKLTEQQYDWMMNEIIEEANACFQLSGLESTVSASGQSRNISWTQWSYIERSFQNLRQTFSQIEKQPFRRLEKLPLIMKREKVQRVEQSTLGWLDRRGHGEDVPTKINTAKTLETTDVYENQLVKKQVFDLFRLLSVYETVEVKDIADKAKRYKFIIQRWLNSPFLKNINQHSGPYTITQKFRKHPVYRQWYQWFDRLFKHKREGIGFDYPIPLKDTFELYEMWCYMKMVKVLRELGFIFETKELFRLNKNGFFLNLAENKQSRIRLKDGLSLYFQRTYQYNSDPFRTYTQRMIPDIVLEGENQMIVFDPKYRVPGNLGTALGEMHKYRDGILFRESGKRAVKEVYILTPTQEENREVMRYFQDDFHQNYQMGAIQMLPRAGEDVLIDLMKNWVGKLI